MKDFLIILGLIVLGIAIFSFIIHNFWISRILSIIASILNIIYIIICVEIVHPEVTSALLCSISLILSDARYHTSIKTGIIQVLKNGAEVEKLGSGVIGFIAFVITLFFIIYGFVVPKFPFLVYIIPIVLLAYNIIDIVYKIITGEEMREPDEF